MKKAGSLSQRLGGNIATLRKARSWTQSTLAERVGVDTETVSRFERGATLPSLLTLEKISKSLRVGIGELLTESSAQPDDLASTISTLLSGLEEIDRNFVLEMIKQSCNHLRQRAK